MSIKKQSKTIKRILKYVFKDYKLLSIIVIISILISATVGVVGVQFIKILIDGYLTPMMESGSNDFSSLNHLLIVMGVVYLVGAICTYLYNRLMVVIAQGVLNKIRQEMFSHMEALPISYFDARGHGEIMSTYTNDVDTLSQMLSQSVPQVFSCIISMVAVFIAMLSTNIYLTLVVLAMVIIMLFVSKHLGGNSSKYFVKQQEDLGELNGYIEEMMEGQKVVKVFNHEEESKENFDIKNDTLCDSMTRANSYANTLMPAIMNIGNIGYVLVAVIGGILSVNNLLTIGSIAAFLQYVKGFTNPLGQVSQQMNSIVMALAGASRIFELMDEKKEVDEGKVTLVNIRKDKNKIVEVEEHTGMWAWKKVLEDGKVHYRELKGHVDLNNVTFGYVPKKTILFDISLEAKAGEKVSFVGATGAGKTTITNLINRFYDVNEGEILYDGIDVKDIKKSSLRSSLGMVLQDTSLFTGTIMENIRYGKLDATDDEVMEAAKLANADTFINDLPHGYDTVIKGSGEGLSQGQKQLLSIARAALNNPPVLVLDEATSSIDTRTEKIVQDGMDKLMEGRTVFVIAHRLSTIRNSDLIMVLDHGHIIERGSHEELMKLHGTYYGLYTGVIEMD